LDEAGIIEPEEVKAFYLPGANSRTEDQAQSPIVGFQLVGVPEILKHLGKNAKELGDGSPALEWFELDRTVKHRIFCESCHYVI
jgi:hypothetical protein